MGRPTRSFFKHLDHAMSITHAVCATRFRLPSDVATAVEALRLLERRRLQLEADYDVTQRNDKRRRKMFPFRIPFLFYSICYANSTNSDADGRAKRRRKGKRKKRERKKSFLVRFDVAQKSFQIVFLVYLICISSRSYQPVPCLKSILHSQHIFYLVFSLQRSATRCWLVSDAPRDFNS